MIIPVYLLFQIIHLETSDSALPPYYVVLCQYYTDKTVGANQQHLSGSQSRTFQTGNCIMHIYDKDFSPSQTLETLQVYILECCKC